MSTRLERSLGSLAAATGRPLTEDLRKQIETVLVDNDLDQDNRVPDWLVELFERVLAGQSTDWIPYPITGYTFPDVFELITRLDEVANVVYEHREESIALTFPTLKVLAEIWLESSVYRIVRHD